MNALANPFVGPRPFQTGEALFGREREVRDLFYLLVAERVILLPAPSGAGKTSLLRAGLVPRLQRDHFVVPGPLRVGLETSPPAGANRYVASVLHGLEAALPPERMLPAGELAALTLAEYASARLERAVPPEDLAFLFDQFEEVLTVDPHDLDAKQAFFRQLDALLRGENRHVVLAVREEYVGALEPYLRQLSRSPVTRFRLDRLGREAALEAIQGPAQAQGVRFLDEAARALLDDLSQVQVQRPDGSFEVTSSPYVEPLQLQVVCRHLWQRLPPDLRVIGPEALSPVGSSVAGDVDTALANYYADCVRAVAAVTGVSERTIRDWFEVQLIGPFGTRNLLRHEPNQTRGLDNRVITSLVNDHLVRQEMRHGALWYEVAHDRLVGAILRDNAAWRMRSLSPFQRRAWDWNRLGRPDSLAVDDRELAEAEAWSRDHPQDLTEVDLQFLSTSRSIQADRRRSMTF